MTLQGIDSSIGVLRNMLEAILARPTITYSGATPASFPEEKGIYIIATHDGLILRAGKTGLRKATLRQRLYQNHLMGKQTGNLPSQLVGSGQCADLAGG